MRAFLPLTRAFAGVRRSRCSSRHSGNDAIGRCGFPPGDGIASSRPRRRAGGKARRAAWPPETRGVGRDRVAAGARGWCRSGSSPARCGDDAGGGRGAGGGADTRAVAEVFVNPAFRIKLSLSFSPKESHVREAQVPVNRVVDSPA